MIEQLLQMDLDVLRDLADDDPVTKGMVDCLALQTSPDLECNFRTDWHHDEVEPAEILPAREGSELY